MTNEQPIVRHRRRRGWRLAVVAALLMGAAVAAAGAWQQWQAQTQRARGQSIYEGRAGLEARLIGHELSLPPMARRCANCHEAAVGQAPAISSIATVTAPGDAPAFGQSYASTLNRASLTEARVRRGGPASRFDAETLCKLLRDGVDPASVLISTAMPRYDASPQQCEDLWAHLVSR